MYRSILVTTFYPKDDYLHHIVSNNWDRLLKSYSILHTHEQKPMLAYRRLPNPKNLSVRAECRVKSGKTLRNNPFLTDPNFTFTHATKQTHSDDFFKKTPSTVTATMRGITPRKSFSLPIVH